MERRMKKLISEIEKHNYNYYTLDNPTISDGEYDRLYDELVKIEKETGITLPDSPTLRVGGKTLEKFQKHKHIVRLLSLDKSQNFEELRDWESRIKKIIENYNSDREDTIEILEYVVEYKFDGLTINLTYENGILIQGATRGNGEVGEGILSQVKTIKNIPLSIPFKGKIEVQGEALMPNSAFVKYNEKAEEPLKNPRNGVAGAIRNLDPKLTAKRNLIAYCYNINYMENKSVDTQLDMLNFLRNNKLPVNKYNKVFDSIENVIEEIKKQESIIKKLDILTDGIVIKVNDIKTREVLGFTQKFPRWAVAYKFKAEEFTTKVLSVDWQVGRTGKITPIANLEPTEINGVTVKRATLNNWDDIQRKKVKLGSKVWVRRSNDVIPEIMGAIDNDGNCSEIDKPIICPDCKSKVYQEGVHIFCTNTLSCKPQLVSRLVHFASRDAMNIEGLSKKTISQLFEEVELKEISQIYDLKYEDLIDLERFGEKKTKNLLEAIDKSKKVQLDKFIYSLGILNVGKKTAGELAKNFKKLEVLEKASTEELIEIDDIGDIVAKSIFDYFNHENIMSDIEKLLKKGIELFYETEEIQESKFTNKIVVLTGTLSSMTRSELRNKLEKLGAKVSGSVSKKTDYIIIGENPGSKYNKGLELGTEILSEEQALDLIDK